MSNAKTARSAARRATPSIHIRALTADDNRIYRALRQRILDLGDGRYFSDSYIREKQLNNEHAWREWCTERPDHCIFGTFANGALIGIMMVTRYGEPEDRTVEWEAIWLHPNYRRLGIAKRAYEKIQQWTEEQGYRRVVTFIRTDNERARHIRQKQGARLVSTKHDEVWADGSIGDVHVFILDLYPTILHARQIQALRRLNEANQFDDDEQRVTDRVSFEITTSR
jgi:RimJ/RimL family protein N-acetyltransferase